MILSEKEWIDKYLNGRMHHWEDLVLNNGWGINYDECPEPLKTAITEYQEYEKAGRKYYKAIAQIMERNDYDAG